MTSPRLSCTQIRGIVIHTDAQTLCAVDAHENTREALRIARNNGEISVENLGLRQSLELTFGSFLDGVL